MLHLIPYFYCEKIVYVWFGCRVVQAMHLLTTPTRIALQRKFVISFDIELRNFQCSNWIAMCSLLCSNRQHSLDRAAIALAIWFRERQKSHQFGKCVHSFRKPFRDNRFMLFSIALRSSACAVITSFVSLQQCVTCIRVESQWLFMCKSSKTKINFRCLWNCYDDDHDDDDKISTMRWILFSFNHYDDSESDIIGLTYKVNVTYDLMAHIPRRSNAKITWPFREYSEICVSRIEKNALEAWRPV